MGYSNEMMPQMSDQRRNNAIRLLAIFVSTGVLSGAAMAHAWVLDLSMQNGFDDQELLSGLGYAAEQNWLEVEQEGLLLTEAGNVAAVSGWTAAALNHHEHLVLVRGR